MIKGWRTKPEWIAHYKQTRIDRQSLITQRIQMQLESDRICREIDGMIKESGNLRNIPKFINYL